MALCTACSGPTCCPTQDADDLYNGLRKTEQIAGLFHRTYSGAASGVFPA